MVNKFLESESLNLLNSGYDFVKSTFTQSYCYRRAENKNQSWVFQAPA